ncbi:serine protease, S1-C subfamily, contains C-terminal PDZ domain [Tissierella praeacuta DSM 18095]|uniref:Serine protease, S1-C subfamily, contains C-terminal PDZ domain n=1 Tax=Tissierella praeacuta DSM 18095 TaxID=1123404 RepID=A0A1M4T959_9FIRM|nr:trypsin-like peptidase domain-containing protein [Tissierella praeacuta]SHE41092.1 serine protease, S1-C subfamily, contains C-terminal PDZ domain [Tissierella praeacuta DSM 18095]SUP04829.1 Putative serine protease HtrA [Tissierella praeacuta]
MDENKEFRTEENYKIPEDIYIYRSYEEKNEPKKRSFKGSFISYIALALIASIVGGLTSSYIAPNLYGKVLPNPKNSQYTASPVNITTNDDINTVSAVAKKAMSSVVGITSVEVQQFFFSQQEVEGIGSGVIIDSNGYILTNSHVVGDGNAKSINVLFENGDKKEGKVLWNDSILDLAVVKVEATGLPVATLGDSDKLEVGEIAVAIGNPLGLEFQGSVTSGIISGLSRTIQVGQSNVIEDLIQTDASINPGNSGGPLLNSKGEVIGINTAKIKSAEGLGFSIPINKAKVIAEEVVKNGTYKTVYMGIKGVSVEEYQYRLGIKLSTEKGVILLEVGQNTPASRAGLLNGDIILKIDDTEISTMNELKKALYKYKQGDKATLTVIRNNTEEKIDIEFTDLN